MPSMPIALLTLTADFHPELVRRLDEYRIAATWLGVRVVDCAALSGGGHDVAIEPASLVERDDVRQAVDEVERLRSAGARVSTIAIRNKPHVAHFDLFAKSSLSVVYPRKSKSSDSRPVLLRHGVWQAGAAVGPGRATERLLDRVVATRGAIHVSLDAGGKPTTSADRLIESAIAYRDQGRLAIGPLDLLPGWGNPARTSPPSRSVLRAA